MRRIIKTVCAMALCVVLFTGCSQPVAQSVSTKTSTAEVEPLKIEFKEAEITKRTDTKSNIPEYTIISDSNEKYDVVWTSSDESVAKVEEGMLCTGKEGSAQITATIDDGVSASITVNVLCFSQPGIQLDFNFACAFVFLHNKVNVILVIILFFTHILHSIASACQIVLYNLFSLFSFLVL